MDRTFIISVASSEQEKKLVRSSVKRQEAQDVKPYTLAMGYVR